MTDITLVEMISHPYFYAGVMTGVALTETVIAVYNKKIRNAAGVADDD